MADPVQRGSVLTASDAAAGDGFGTGAAISADGNVISVGAFNWEGPNTDQGSVYIYDRSGSTWVQRGSVLTAADAAAGDGFGVSTALADNGIILAVGAFAWEGASVNQGGVYIYDWNGSAWVQRGSVLTASDAAASDNFCRLSFNSTGTILAVGAAGRSSSTGGVYIYDWNGSAWIQRGSVLTAADAAAGDNFGISTALSASGTVLAVGAYTWEGTNTDQGGVYIYDWNGSAWVQRGSVLTASDAATGDGFGTGISLSSGGDVLAVGAITWEGANTDQGGVYIYDWNGSTWAQRGSVLVASDAAAGAGFGTSSRVNASADTLVVGAYNRTGTLAGQGGVYTYDIQTSFTPSIRNVSLTGLTPTIPAFSAQPFIAGVSVTGFVPAMAAFIQTAGQGSVAVTGDTPLLAKSYEDTPSIGSLSVGGQVALFNPGVANVLGRGFFSALNQSQVTLGGRGFSTTFPTLTIVPELASTITGQGFSTAPSIFGGAVVTGGGFRQAPVITVLANNEFTVTGRGLATQLGFSFSASTNGAVNGRGFSSAATILGGAVVTGRGFSSLVQASVLTSEIGVVTGRGFGSSLDSYTLAPTTITVLGGGFASGLSKITVTGQGIATYPTIQFTSASVNTEALVMNVVNNQVSRYTNYPFIHIISIGGTSYGVKADGLYLLGGSTDINTIVNGFIITAETDFGIFQSKNVPYVYLNGDDKYKVTPIVDGINKPSVSSTFKGRKAHPGRGNKGRYWAFKIEGIEHLQGVEYLPEILQRRVK